MARLFTIAEIVEATGGRPEGVTSDGVCSLSIDSRDIPPDALFIAIRGAQFDGHDFVRSALENGAVAALVSQEKAVDLGDRLIVVPDALEGLVDLARYARARMGGKVVAVTGSAGKTTTKEAIRTVLSAAGATHASIRSFNNHWGVPLVLARMPPTTQFGVFEIGMNHAGEITPLTLLVRPHIAVITTVAAAHLEFFDSVAAIAAAKAEIFRGIEPGGTAVLNIDHDHVGVLLEAAREAGVRRIVTYGVKDTADWRVMSVEADGDGSAVSVHHEGQTHRFHLASPGRHMAANAVAALAVAQLCGMPIASALGAIEGFGAPEGRGAATRLGESDRQILLIDESYNANMASMAAALDVFATQEAPGGRKLLVLGDMLELGAEGPRLHEALEGAVRACGADSVYLVGPAMANLAGRLGSSVAGYARDVDGITEPVLNGLAYGDAIMVKGSNGVRLGRLVARIREKFQ